MGLFDKKEGGLMDVIRCDEPTYLIWKWRPAGQEANSTKKENAIRYGSSLRVKDGEIARKSMIEMFPIPNSKEDLTEFAILASGQIKQVNSVLGKFSLQAKRQLWLNEIWVTKFNQVYTKARIAMKDDPNGLNAISQLMTEAGIKK